MTIAWRPRRALRMMAAALATVTLAACSSDGTQNEGLTLARTLASSVTGLVRPADEGDGGPSALEANPAATIARVLQSQPGPLMLVVVPERDQTALLAPIGQNLAYRTWATNSREALILKNGVLAGTRGLGDDLMSSEIESVGALIRGRRAGQATRTYRYLDGENKERPLQLTCTVARGGSESVQMASGQRLSTVQMIEECRGAGREVRNVYFVTGSGRIPQSRQWQGPEIGDIAIQILRF